MTRDEILNVLASIKDDAEYEYLIDNSNGKSVIALETAMDWLQHGTSTAQWLPKKPNLMGYTHYCSRCGGGSVNGCYLYCPNCGSKMMEVEN